MCAFQRTVLPSRDANPQGFLFGLLAICVALVLRAILTPLLVSSHPTLSFSRRRPWLRGTEARGRRYSLLFLAL
jgi:hypothetical protein